jgi:hypothetical protein
VAIGNAALASVATFGFVVVAVAATPAPVSPATSTAASVSAVATYQPPALPASVAEPSVPVRLLPGPKPARHLAVRPTHHAKPAVVKSKPVHRPKAPTVTAPVAKPRVVRKVVRTLTFRTALDLAIARIPTYRPGAARWVVSREYGQWWGTANWYTDTIYVSPDTPRARLYDVVVHEWSHELSVLDYGADVDLATAAMNAWFGGTGLVGAERAADCMAIEQGATWTHYTTCDNAHWRAGARTLLSGERL